MTAPGVATANVAITTANAQIGRALDSIPATISATGPMTAGLEFIQNGFGSIQIHITASAPGTGTITVSAGGKSASISVTAVALSFNSIDMADGNACGIALDETAWCWGGNQSGQLGTETSGRCFGSACQYSVTEGNPTPFPVDGDRTFTRVATAGYLCIPGGGAESTCGKTCALTAAGAVWCWGEGFGFAPSAIAGLALKSLTVLPSPAVRGGSMSCGLATDGKAYCFTATATTPIGNGMTFTSLSAGITHSCGVDAVGDVYCWGASNYGNLGADSTDVATHPTPERAVSSVKFTAVDVGRNSTCALDTAGVVRCWGQGYAADGVSPPPACVGTTLCQPSPRRVEGGRTYVAFSRPDAPSGLCALAADGSVDCWSAYNKAPFPVPLPEPMTNLSLGKTWAGSEVVACGVSVTHVAYCWTPAGVVTKLGQ
jgi:hypothetical protein